MNEHDEAEEVLRATSRTKGVPENDREDVGQERRLRYYTYRRAGADSSAVRRRLGVDAAHAAIRYGVSFHKNGRRATIVQRESYAEDPADIVVRAESARRLWDLVDRLPANQAVAVRLSAEGFSGPEIAARLGMTHAAVRQCLSRGRRTLRGWLDTLGPLLAILVVIATLIAAGAIARRFDEPTTLPGIPHSQGFTFGLQRPGDAVPACDPPPRVGGSVAPPGVLGQVGDPEVHLSDTVLPVVVGGLPGIGPSVPILSEEVTLLTTDGRNVVNVFSHTPATDSTSGVSAGPGRSATMMTAITVSPCLDRVTRRPVALGGRYLARALLVWRDPLGVEHPWYLPDRRVDVAPQPARSLPPLAGAGCEEFGRGVYVGFLSHHLGSGLSVWLSAENVEARDGVARLTYLLTNVSGEQYVVRHDGHRLGPPDGHGRRYVLAPGEVVAVPVAYPMTSCVDGRPAERVEAGTYLVRDGSMWGGEVLGGGSSGAVVTVP